MVKNKSIIAFFLSLIIIFNSSILCFADGYPTFSLSDWNSLSGEDKRALVKSQVLNYVQMCTDVVAGNSGAIVDAVARQTAARYVLSGDTDTDVGEYIANGMSLNDDGTKITFSPDVVNLFRDAVKSYVDSQGYFYAYSTSFPSPSKFHSYNNYSFAKSKLVDNGYVSFLNSPSSNPVFLNVYTGIGILDYANIVLDKTIETTEGTAYRCFVYSSSWNKLSSSYIKYEYYDSGNLTYSDNYVNSAFSFTLFSSYGMNYSYRYLDNPNSSFNANTVFTSSPKRYRVFKTLADFKDYSVLQASYYAGKNFTTDHVTTPMTYSINSIVNAPTYEVVTNYINEYNGENQSFPSDGAIANYISGYAQNVGNSGGTNTGIDGNNNNTGVGNNNNVGSGGSSSNGSGSSGGDVFGFLGGIGSVFGSLIKGVGELITNLLTALTEVMTSLTTEVPDSVIGFMGSLMSWVPPDIWILVRLAMVLGLVMAVVKKFF